MERKHPLTCLLYLLGAAAVPMLWLHPVILTEAVLLLVLVNIQADGGRQMKKTWMMFCVLALLFLLINPLFSHRGRIVLFELWDNPITLESVIYGALLSLSLVSVLLAFLAGNVYLDADKWMFLFSRIVQKTTFALLLCMRQVPLLRQRAAQLRAVQQTKYQLQETTWRQRLGGGARTLNALVSWALEDALLAAQSMRARGYGLHRKRTFYFPYTFRREDLFLCLFFAAAGLALLALRWSGGLIFSVYPRMMPVEWNGKLAAAGILYGVYLLSPVWLEMEEWLRWRCLK